MRGGWMVLLGVRLMVEIWSVREERSRNVRSRGKLIGREKCSAVFRGIMRRDVLRCRLEELLREVGSFA